MVRVKVCPCFRLSEYEELLEPVANRPWDAWHLINEVLSGWYYLFSFCSDDVVHNFNLSKYFVIEPQHPPLAKACLSRDPKRLK